MKNTKKNNIARATELSVKIDAIQAKIDACEDATSDEAWQLFCLRERLTQQWVNIYAKTLKRSELVKKLRWC